MTERTDATNIMMQILEEFGESEPESFLAIWTNKDEDIVCKSNCSASKGIGLAEYAKFWILKDKGLT